MQEPPYHNDNPYTSYGSSSQENASPYGNAGGQNYGNQGQQYDNAGGQVYGNQGQPYGGVSGQSYGNQDQPYGSPVAPGYGNQGQNYAGQPYGYGAGGPIVAPNNGRAIAALIFGIIGIVLSWIPYFGLLLPIVGIILGIIARRRPVQQGLAITGLICGIVGLVIAVFITLFFTIGIIAATRSSY